MREVVVIGGGPAGLAAAAAAREAGAAVVLLEAGDDVGGQYWRHLPPERPARAQARLHHGWPRFTALRAQLAADPGCTVLTGASVWAVEPVRAGSGAGADGVSGSTPPAPASWCGSWSGPSTDRTASTGPSPPTRW